MKNLITFVMDKGALEKENLATEVLAKILGSPFAEKPLRKRIERLGSTLPCSYEIETQQGCEDNRGIPDLFIRGEDGRRQIIIDSKFGARLAKHQPKSYLDHLDEGGLLLFIAPAARVKFIRNELAKELPDVTFDWTQSEAVHIGGKLLSVTSWTEFLCCFGSEVGTDGQSLRYNSYVNELKGFCDVASKKVFQPLSADQIQGGGIASAIHQMKWLAEEIINQCIKDGTLDTIPSKGNKNKNELGADSDSSIFFGQDLLINGFEVWVGFWAAAWEELSVSPLWIAFLDKGPRIGPLVAKIKKQKGNAFVLRHTFAEDEEDNFLIPIKIIPGTLQDEVVLSASQFIAELKQLIAAA